MGKFWRHLASERRYLFMAIELDSVSRATVGRFVVKVNLSLLIALFSKSSLLLSASRCLQLYALLMAAIAVLTRQRYSPDSFNHWSEALWLAFVAAGLQLLQRASL